MRKGALLAAAGLPSYFLTRRHAPLHGRVLRSRRGLSESVAGGQVADQEQGSSLEASPLKMAGEGEWWWGGGGYEVFVHFYIFFGFSVCEFVEKPHLELSRLL